MKNTKIQYITCSVLVALLICAVLLSEIYIENECLDYAGKTYVYSPLYAARAAFCLLWAILARVAVAAGRKNNYNGKIEISVPAVTSAFVFIAAGAVDLIFLTGKLILNQIFDIMLLFSVLCCVMRKK